MKMIEDCGEDSLQSLHGAARKQAGPQAVREIYQRHGSRNGVMGDVPEDNIAACARELRALANGGTVGVAKKPESLADEDFVSSIYAKWNGAKAAT